MLPHSTFGIRIRKGKSKGFWRNAGNITKVKRLVSEIPDEGKIEGVSDVFKKLLRGNK